MKRLLVIVAVIAFGALFQSSVKAPNWRPPKLGSVTYVAGFQDFVIPGATNLGYPGTWHNGTAIPYRVFTPPDAAETRNGTGPNLNHKYPAIIFHHGCGEKTSTQSGRQFLNTSELGKLTNTPPFAYLQNSSGQLWDRDYQIDEQGNTEQVFWFGPQLWGPVGAVNCSGGTGGYTFTYLYLTWYMLQEIKENYSDIVDTNKIVIAGLSQGGGACNLAIQDSIICSMLSAALIMCPGYDNYSGFPPTGRTNPTDEQNWDDVAASGLPIWYIHSEDDNTTVDCGGGSGCSRNSVVAINSRNPLFVPLFDEPTGTSHSNSWLKMLTPTSWNTDMTNSNGSTFNMMHGQNRNPIEWALQFSKNSRVSRRPDGK